jgi:hypothetical protein
MGAPQKETRKKQTGGASTTVYLFPGDEKQLRYIQEQLGTSVSEAIRTSIRVYASVLAQMK